MAITKASRYFEFHFKILRFLGIGYFHFPDEKNNSNYPTIFYLLYGIWSTSFNVIGYTISEIFFAYYVWATDRESSLQFLAYTMVGTHFFATLKVLILIKNNKKIQKIVKILEIDSKIYACDEEILKGSNAFTRIATGCFFIMGEITITLMSIYSAIEDMKRTAKIRASNFTLDIPRDTPFTAFVPWSTDENWKFNIAFIYCVLGMYWMGTTLIITDTMIASIMAHISGQFKMVQKYVENSGHRALDKLESRINKSNSLVLIQRARIRGVDPEDPNDEFYVRWEKLMLYFTNEEFNKAMYECLSDAIQYHQLILEATQDLQTSYSQGFFCQTLSSLYVIGLLMVQSAMNLTNINSLKFYNMLGFLLSIVCQLFIKTYTANEIILEADKVFHSAYSCHWYCADKKTAKLVEIIIQKAQRPVRLVAGRIIIISNELFVTIIKFSYQIFTIITTTMNRSSTKK